MSELDQAKSIAVSIAKATVALSMLEEMGDAVETYDKRKDEHYTAFQNAQHHDNDWLVGRLLATIRSARNAIDAIDDHVAGNDLDED